MFEWYQSKIWPPFNFHIGVLKVTYFEKVIKVDTNVYANRSFHPKELLEFIEKKLKKDKDRVVFKELQIEKNDG